MLEILLDLFKNPKDTCSVVNQRDNCITFVRNIEYAEKYLKYSKKDLLVFAPKELEEKSLTYPFNIQFIFSDNPEYDFTLLHNFIYRNDNYNFKPIIDPSAIIHPTTIIGIDGLKVVYNSDNKKIQFKHTGTVVICNDVEISALCVVHRATLDETVIGAGTKIGAKTNIGHNNDIGKNCVFGVGVLTNGSVTIGDNCWLGTGCIIKNGISICNDVVIGTGSVVVKDIVEPGIYVGNPAKFLKEKQEGWNF